MATASRRGRRRVVILTPSVRPRGGVRNLAVRAVGPYNNARVRQLSRRVDELEREVQQARRLHLRVATLQDLVTELLLDPESQDEGVTARALRKYRQESL